MPETFYTRSETLALLKTQNARPGTTTPSPKKNSFASTLTLATDLKKINSRAGTATPEFKTIGARPGTTAESPRSIRARLDTI